MDPSGGAVVIADEKKRASEKPPSESDNSGGSATDVDRLSPLANDMLVKILSSVDSSPDAIRTCVLSRNWRTHWKLVPELRLPFFPEPASMFRDALDDHKVPLRHLQVEGHGGQGALPNALATWLPAAARRVTGCFVLRNNDTDPIIHDDYYDDYDEEEEEEEEHEQEQAAAAAAAMIVLPCFEKATSISICLGFVGSFAMPAPPPPAADAAAAVGVFSLLTDLCLERVWFHHPSELGDAVSSARSPRLQKLKLRNTPGLAVLAISSTSLLKMELEELKDLQKITVEAPELKEFTVTHCFIFSLKPSSGITVAITAPELVLLNWRDDMESQRHIQAQLSKFPLLRSLGSFLFFVYGLPDDDFGTYNRAFLKILQGFQFLEKLTLTLAYVLDIENYQYLMEDMRMLPKFTTLHVIIMSIGHSFGASLLHILRLCTGIRKLVLQLHAALGIMQEPLTCPPGCNCEHQSNWRSETLLLPGLEEIEIQRFGRTTHDLDFVERLFGWATQLTKATIIFDILVSEGVAMEMCRMFELFSRPGIHIEFRYHNNKKVLNALED